MNVLGLPFNKILLLKKSEISGTILMLDDLEEYQNHLGTVHASAQYALAEASSGEIIERNFGDWNGAYFPVVRRAEVKYRNLAKGKLFSTGSIDAGKAIHAKTELQEKGRTLVDVMVKIVDKDKKITFESTFTWFITKNAEK